ncbi:hypothetical protein QJS04_geneDACA008722 [Acorus gramineus]|uniref:PGG domain-containing protein n=1 Tax=Acorus gramineus TaxID=55184 RepID=A0AAV9ADF2_ACOGR|nr:hypothetical protein QJS04_geneDACA008722 [Acorus gramineus]
MDPRLYKSAMLGNTILLKEVMEEANIELDLSLQLTPQKNTALHIVAKHGHRDFASELLRKSPALLSQPNSDGDLPLHLAAQGGHKSLVNLFLDSLKNSPPREGEATDLENNGAASALWRTSNSRGNNVLHDALRCGCAEVAVTLMKFDPSLADSVNLAGESPLFMASELGLMVAVESIVSSGSSSFSREGPKGRTPLHAAVIGRHLEITRLLIEKLPDDLIKQEDTWGRNALHYAAWSTWRISLEMSDLLVTTERMLAYVKDNDGLTPFMVAIQAGSFRTACKILDHCSDVGELRDACGRNALHIAFKCHRSETLRALLKRPELVGLVNAPDNDGNTPLHVATQYHHCDGVWILLTASGVDLRARNNEGLTVADVSLLHWDHSILKIFYIWRCLIRQGAVLSQFKIAREYLGGGPLYKSCADMKSCMKTMALVVMLLATISFTAPFMLPGEAILTKKPAFMVFLLFDTVTLGCCLILTALLLFGSTGDPESLSSTAYFSAKMLVLAFWGSLLAFGAGVYAMISDENFWLAIVICLMVFSVPFICMIRVSQALTWRFSPLLEDQLEPSMEGHIKQNIATTGQ